METSSDKQPLGQVPDDYPSSDCLGAAAVGALPKAVQYDGFFFEDGLLPPDRRFRWSEFERLARIFVEKCRRNEHGKYAHLTRPEILTQYLERMHKLGWQTLAECRWLIRRIAGLLDWTVPANALDGDPIPA